MLHRQFVEPSAEAEELHPRRDWPDYRAIYGSKAVVNREFYNIGAGRFKHRCWTTVDFMHERYAGIDKAEVPDIVYDLTQLQPLPVKDESAWAVFTSHTIEHVRDDAVQNMFNEAHRILRPGGAFRITVPDFDLAYRAYRSGDLRYFRTFTAGVIREDVATLPGKRNYGRDPDVTRAFLNQFARQAAYMKEPHGKPLCDYVAQVFAERPLAEAADAVTALCSDEAHAADPSGHINWFNYDKAFGMLRRAGFKADGIYKSGYGQSSVSVLRNLRYFDRTRPCFSLYVEAIK